jgi:FixJ family two-component response regulator
MWFTIITVVAGILAAVLGMGGGAIDFIEKYFNYRDNSYQPMDTERQAARSVQEQSTPTNQSRP